MRAKPIVIGVLLTLGVIAWLVLDPGRFLTLERLHEDQQWLIQLKNANPVLFGALFFAVYVLVTGASLPGAAPWPPPRGALLCLLGGVDWFPSPPPLAPPSPSSWRATSCATSSGVTS